MYFYFLPLPTFSVFFQSSKNTYFHHKTRCRLLIRSFFGPSNLGLFEIPLKRVRANKGELTACSLLKKRVLKDPMFLNFLSRGDIFFCVHLRLPYPALVTTKHVYSSRFVRTIVTTKSTHGTETMHGHQRMTQCSNERCTLTLQETS